VDTPTPWSRLLELARIEATLVEEGRWEDARQLGAEREALLRRLPAPPPEARADLEAALALVESSAAATAAAMAEVRETLAHLAVGRQAIAAYAHSNG